MSEEFEVGRKVKSEKYGLGVIRSITSKIMPNYPIEVVFDDDKKTCPAFDVPRCFDKFGNYGIKEKKYSIIQLPDTYEELTLVPQETKPEELTLVPLETKPEDISPTGDECLEFIDTVKVGDMVESVHFGIGKIAAINSYGSPIEYPIIVKFLDTGDFITFSKDGIYNTSEPDSYFNIKKYDKNEEPLVSLETKPEDISLTEDECLEFIDTVKVGDEVISDGFGIGKITLIDDDPDEIYRITAHFPDMHEFKTFTKHGRFISCSSYPKFNIKKYIKKEEPLRMSDEDIQIANLDSLQHDDCFSELPGDLPIKTGKRNHTPFRFDLIPGLYSSLSEVARVAGYGAGKYGVNNWKYLDLSPESDHSPLNHAIAHLLKYSECPTLSTDDEILSAQKEERVWQLAKAAWNCLALIYFVKNDMV